MIVLCSNGLSSDTLVSHMREKLNDCKTAALVVTADNEYKENNYHVQRCVAELESLDLKVDLFDLDKQAADGLLSYNVVEFIGGNPYYLLQAIRNSHAETVLRNIAENKMLIGWSAAVFVFGPTLELVNRYSPEMNFMGLTDLTALRLTNTEVLPHYSKFLKRFDQFEAQCLAYEEKHHTKVIRLNDGDGVIIDGKETILCRQDECDPYYSQAKAESYTMRFWFEHGGGCLWSADDTTHARYGYKVDYSTLPISDNLKEELHALEQRYRSYLDWDDPAAGCRWTSEEKMVFVKKAATVYTALCTQLNGNYTIINELYSSI